MKNIDHTLTAMAFFNAIEKDFRTIISEHYAGSSITAFLGDSEQLFKKRFADEHDGTEEEFKKEYTLENLINYCDFADHAKIIFRNKDLFQDKFLSFLKTSYDKIEALASVRNKAAHSRQLYIQDVENLNFIVNEFINFDHKFFENTKTLNDNLLLNEKTYFNTGINKFADKEPFLNHNLPIPDFKDTMFLGRVNELKRLHKWYKTAHPISVIYGDGGFGKTALALKFLYEIIDETDCTLDQIFWIQSKTNQVLGTKVQDIQDAIVDSDGVFKELLELNDAEDELNIYDLQELYKDYEIILVLDNIETILDNKIMDFLETIQGKWKVLITSRIQIPSLGFSVEVKGLESQFSKALFYKYCRFIGREDIVKNHNQEIENWCSSMKSNPGYIKWFINVLITGVKADQILDKNGNEFIRFSHQNIFNHLGKSAKIILEHMLCIDRSWSLSELSNLLNIKVEVIESSIFELKRTSFITELNSKTIDSTTNSYGIDDYSLEYLNEFHSPDEEIKTKVSEWHDKFNINSREIIRQEESVYSPNYIHLRGDHDKHTAIELKNVLRLSSKLRNKNKGNTNELKLEIIEKLKQLHKVSFDYFEVFRITAFVHANWNNLEKAKNNYQKALELCNDHAPLLYFSSLFFSRYYSNYDSISLIKQAEEIDPKSSHIKFQYALILKAHFKYELALKKLVQIEAEFLKNSDYFIGKWSNTYILCCRGIIFENFKKHEYEKATTYIEKILKVFSAELTERVVYFDTKILSIVSNLSFSIENQIRLLLKNNNVSSEKFAKIMWQPLSYFKKILRHDQKEFLQYKNEVGRSHKKLGIIISLTEDQARGIIKTSDNLEIFFYCDQCSFCDDYGLLNDAYINKEVSFTIGKNTHGVCARSIDLED
jgi:hypothetical protein